ncbi:MAG TPA: OmpA family protein [Prolixibacteraceae bacterium]|nr:OmpA family protein [Prolixibacteraceae bacterium]
MKAKCLILCFFCFLSFSLSAQLNIKNKIVNKVTEKVDQKVDEAIDPSEESTDENQDAAEQEEATEEESAAEQQETTVPQEKKSTTAKLESYSKYDFVPGDKILFYEDFSQDAIGDFPAKWTTNGSGEVKTLNIAGGNWFHLNAVEAAYCFMQGIAFPANFIIEFDLVPDDDYESSYLSLYSEEEKKELDDGIYPGKQGLNISFGLSEWESKGYDNEANSYDAESESTIAPIEKGKVNHVIIWVQNRRVRIYHRGSKVLDAPTGIIAGTKFSRLRFSLWSGGASKPYLSNIKVTTAAPDTRSKLLTEGKLVSYGIYFDVNKEVVKAESYGTLNDIANVLKENPNVRIKIVGHTDADGADAANLDLSKRRGASVKNELVKNFGIAASRIESDGKGESEPIAPNDTPSNKALNRRVEFIKL